MRWISALGLGSLALCATLAFSTPAARAGEGNGTRIALSHEEPEISFDGIALSDCIDFLRDISNINVHVDWKALEAVNVNKDTPVTLHLHGVTLRTALTMVLNEAGEGHLLTFYIDDNVLEITSEAEADRMLVTMVYPVGDLLMDIPDFTDAPNFNLATSSNSSNQTIGAGSTGTSSSSSSSVSPFGGGASGSGATAQETKKQKADDLVKLIESTIRPDIWRDNGGTSNISFFNDSLIITAPRSVQEAIGGPLN
jgi:type II secretory pathway component GspD/PulD (secretin)